MRTLRKAIFWLHLAAGILSGLVILVLGVTGTLMTYERQILEWAEQKIEKPATEVKGPETLLAPHVESKPAPTALLYHKDPERPATVQFGREKSVLVNPYSGEQMGDANNSTRGFFRWVLSIHRWLGMEGASRETGGAIIAAGNLVFLVLVISGLWLWCPRRWTRPALKAITKVQMRLKGRARDWNWHNVFGFWACIPLFLIITTGAVMAYPWANALLFKAFGENPPPPRGQAGGAPGASGAAGGERGRMAEGGRREGGGERREGGGERARTAEGGRPEGGGERRPGGGERGGEGREGRGERGQAGPVSLAGLDAGLGAVKAANPEWMSIQVSIPTGKTANFTVMGSHRGRPDLRRQLSVDLSTGAIVKNEGFEAQTTARKARSWARYIHTGEAGGWIGQTIAGLAAASAVVLVWTGFALSWRRFFKRKSASKPKPAARKLAA